MPSHHMHCGDIWDLVQIYLEQKLAVDTLLHHPSYSQGEILLLKIFTLPEIELETAMCKAVTLP